MAAAKRPGTKARAGKRRGARAEGAARAERAHGKAGPAAASKPAVLVTGAAGYLGRLTVETLAGRRKDLAALVALDVRSVPSAERRPGVEYVDGDIGDPKLAELIGTHGIDTVVHLASIVRAPKGAPEDLAYRVDVLGTRNVLAACVRNGVKRLIVTSSGAAYGYHADNAPWLDEEDPIRGNDEFPYSRHKRLVEEMLAEHRVSHPELAQLVLRPGTILGDGTSSPITDLFEKPVILGVAGSDSPFVFIWDRDVVACIVAGVLDGKTGIFNLAGDGAMTTREIARRLGKPYVPIPAELLGAALGVLKTLGLTQYGPEQVRFLRYRPVLANRRLKRDFGFTPTYTSREVFDLWWRRKRAG